MGTNQSKSSPDVQMRLRMEHGFDDDDGSDINALTMSGARGIGIGDPSRSQSNFARSQTDRLGNGDNDDDNDEYFNNIYNNKRVEKSLISIGGGSLSGVKSAPVSGTKDPEVAAALAELEDTFKVLGDAPLKNGGGRGDGDRFTNDLGTSEISKRDFQAEQPHSQTGSSSSVNHGRGVNGYDDVHSPYSSSDSSSSSQSIPNNRQLMSRPGEASYGEMSKKHSKQLEINRTQLDSSGQSVPAYSGSSSSSNSHANISSVTRGGGGEQRFLISSYGSSSHPIQGKNGSHSHNHNPQSLLMQQRREFQSHQRKSGNNESSSQNSSRNKREICKQGKEHWTYQPPKIDGFDVDKFKQANSKVTPTAIVILREEDDKGYYSQSPEVPSYTKDELDLIASLERAVY